MIVPSAEQLKQIQQIRERQNYAREWHARLHNHEDWEAIHFLLILLDTLSQELERLKGELRSVDAVLERRPALDQPTRWENIQKAITMAAKADEAIRLIDAEKRRAERAELALTTLREEREQKDHEDKLSRAGSSVTLSPERATAPTDREGFEQGQVGPIHVGYKFTDRGTSLPQRFVVPQFDVPSCIDADRHGLETVTRCRQCGWIARVFNGPESADARFTPVAESQASGSATESDLRTQIAHLTEERNKLHDAGMPTDIDAAVGWLGRLIAKCELADRLTEEREGLIRERDLALAHDTQPYPTAHAYEQVCKARDKWQATAAALTEVHERLRTLSAKWRTGIHPMLHSCAKELGALLSPREGTQQEPPA